MICLFPGQGSQEVGMGEDLFSDFLDLVYLANDILGYDIREICINNTDNKIHQTKYTQPILFVVNALSYFKFLEERENPDIVLGHSLGEFNALLAAGIFDFEDGLKIVKKRGELMAEVKNGGMAAVIGLAIEDVSQILQENYPELDIANINTRNQIVISGPKQLIEKAGETFEEEYASYKLLAVSGAFHSRYMKPVQEKFRNFLQQFNFAEPKLEVISNVSARPYTHNKIIDLLADQIASPVLWKDSIEYLLHQYEIDCVQLGPAKILTNLYDKIKQQFTALDNN